MNHQHICCDPSLIFYKSKMKINNLIIEAREARR